jgi:ribonuclease D
VNFISFPGKIHLINNDRELRAVASGLNLAKTLGFDTETKPQFQKGPPFKVALLQLATETDAYIVRLHYVTEFQILKEVFENRAIVKVGVAVGDDIKKIQRVVPFLPQGFVEMQFLAKKKGLKNFGLKGMAEEVLHASLSKGPKMTNWEAQTLTERQLMYAATDAWIGLRLYDELMKRPDLKV